MMIDARKELEEKINGKTIKCALIGVDLDYHGLHEWEIKLKVSHSELHLNEFLHDLEFGYNNSYVIKYLYGIVWFTDDSWLERGEYDGSEWWEMKTLPNIPKELQ